MIKNQLKFLARNLVAGKLYTVINIVGLAIGITALVWAFQDYRFSFSFDDFHQDREHIFRVITKNDAGDLKNGYCPLPVGEFAKKEFSSVKEFVRWEGMGLAIKADQDETLNSYIHFTDPAFFDFFNFTLVSGSKDLTDRSAILLTESEAKKFFGDRDPIGKTLILHAGESYQQPLTVKGVLKDVPINSSLRFNALTNFNNYIRSDSSFLKSDDWSWLVDALFLKIPDESQAKRLEQDFKKYAVIQNNARKDLKIAQFFLVSMADLADKGEAEMNNDSLELRPDDSAVYGPMILAILILLSACLNFANTTVARSNKRLKEMGVRKVLGGSTRQLIIQQLLECGAIVFCAILLSLAFTAWWLPTFNNMFDGIKLNADYLKDMALLRFMIFILFGVTIIAGIYPAYYSARYNATQIFRGGVKYGGTNLFSRLLLGFQIIVAFITVTAGFGFARNSAFQRDYNFGFNQNNIIGIQTPKGTNKTMYDALSQVPEVKALATTRGHIGFSWRNMAMESEGVKKEINYLETGENYFSVMGIQMLAGRKFNENGEGDIYKNAIVSANLCSQYGWTPENAIGKQFRVDTVSYSIIGVTKDIYMGGFFNQLQPIVMVKGSPDLYRYLIVQANPNSLRSVYDQLKAKWTTIYPLKPFDAFYQDELETEAQKVNESIATIFFWFAIISILLTATGMFALISLTILKKSREIAIRRVVGAGLNDIVLVIHQSYLLIFFIASFIGIYAGTTLTKLLMDLVFKINIGINAVTITQSFIGICFLILGVISIKIWQVNRMKPAMVLKSN